MKTQQQHKALVPKEILADAEKIVKELESDNNVVTFDEGASFDSHWSYSYIMDYIWSHRKVKKRKS